MKHKIIVLWFAAVAITLAAVIYQRITGPSNPQHNNHPGQSDGTEYSFTLPRSHGGMKDARIEIPIADTSFTGILYYKRYPVHEPWTEKRMIRDKASLVAYLPHQPPAGKLEYRLVLYGKRKGDPCSGKKSGYHPVQGRRACSGNNTPCLADVHCHASFQCGRPHGYYRKFTIQVLYLCNHGGHAGGGNDSWSHRAEICFWRILDGLSLWVLILPTTRPLSPFLSGYSPPEAT